jgi:tRNA 2-thiouridine synthesizing protein E
LLRLDDDGYLEHLTDWDKDVAENLAELEQINLLAPHWELIHLVREYYVEFEHAPSMRPLVTWIKRHLGQEKGNSRYLHRLFKVSPAKQLARISGLPKPTKCL